MSTRRINLISGPRNISTALMYSWANREDTTVIDEPWYAYYLHKHKIDYHPGTQEILGSLPIAYDEVLRDCVLCEVETPIYFIKGMAHHFIDSDLSCLNELDNVFLIRDPAQLITSFVKVIETPTLQDIGLKIEWEIYKYLNDRGKSTIVIDSNDILSDPRGMLKLLCEKLNVPFSEKMLSWEPGKRAEDGSWAPYWYDNVWKSIGFGAPDKRERVIPDRLKGLYEESLDYYNRLKACSLTII